MVSAYPNLTFSGSVKEKTGLLDETGKTMWFFIMLLRRAHNFKNMLSLFLEISISIFGLWLTMSNWPTEAT